MPKNIFDFFLVSLIISSGTGIFSNENLCAQTVTADSIIQTSPCAGSNIYIPYTVSGGNFNFGNVFTAQLSDNMGSFSNPTNIGSLPYWSSGLIIGTIPLTTPFGIFYKIRIVATTPADTSPPSPNNVIVTTVAQIATVVVNPNDTVCNGDSATLTVITPAQDYVWSIGETTQSIDVSQSGVYTVTVTDMLGCKTVSDPITITIQNCMSVQNIFSSNVIKIYPNPFSEKVTLQIINRQIMNYKFVIFDMLGNIVFQSEINPAQSGTKTEIQRGTLQAGIFFYKIVGRGEIIQTGKIIIQ